MLKIYLWYCQTRKQTPVVNINLCPILQIGTFSFQHWSASHVTEMANFSLSYVAARQRRFLCRKTC